MVEPLPVYGLIGGIGSGQFSAAAMSGRNCSPMGSGRGPSTALSMSLRWSI
ncbi:MAG: hypothetical protein IAE80_18785 [Anaerolinea sp.]|nr:hypothetical protein [Anaerolinea sp.]